MTGVARALVRDQIITASGSAIHRGDPGQELGLLWRISGPVTGTNPTIQFTIQEVDPSDELTPNGSSSSSPVITGASTGKIVLHLVDSSAVLLSWVVTGTTPSFGGVNATTVSKETGNQAGATTVTGSDGTNSHTLATDVNGIQYAADISIAAATQRIPNALAGGIRGMVSTNAQTEVAVRSTAYTEQASNAQRSINSTNVADAAAGTGARTVQVTYYSLTAGLITGPFTETVTLNGTTAVNTVSATICFIEKMEVLTAGSGGVNAGAIQIFTTTAGGGSVFASIAIASRATFYAHHYVANGRTCYITDFFASSTAANGKFQTWKIRSLSYSIADAAERISTDSITTQGDSPTLPIHFYVPKRITGNNRFILYVVPGDSTNQVQSGELRYFEI